MSIRRLAGVLAAVFCVTLLLTPLRFTAPIAAASAATATDSVPTDSADARTLLRQLAAGIAGDADTLAAFDRNGDGVVDTRDARAMLTGLVQATTTTTVLSTTAIATTTIATVTTAIHGIDVSAMQGTIDWEAVASTDIGFAILRMGFGDDEVEQDDTTWEINAAACEAYGIPYGAYLYSYAESTEQAYSEARHALRLLEGHDAALPIFLDLEEFPDMTPTEYADIADAFCNTVAAAGYKVGVYANLYWWEEKLTDPRFDEWYRWVAQYYDVCEYNGIFHLWQYTDQGVVPGITENTVDMNWCYMDLSLFGVTPRPTTATTTTTTTTTDSVSLLPTQPTGITVVGVSSLQGAVDWQAVAASDIDAAMLRCGFGDDEVTQDDLRWEENAAACEMYGIPYGATFQCYARDIAAAQSEAQHALRLLQGKALSLPVLYEMNYSDWQGELTQEEYAAIATVFCDTLREAGYTVGVLATLNWWEETLTAPCFDSWYRGVMQYHGSCDYDGEYHFWQYTGSDTVDGVNGTVYRYHCYTDFYHTD